MNDLVQQIVSGLVLMVLGAMGTGIIWIVKAILQLQKDVTAAHEKLRKK